MPRVDIIDLLGSAGQTQVIDGTAKDITTVRKPILEEPEVEKPYEIPPGPLRQLDPTRVGTKAQVMEQLNGILPLNQYDLPDYIYRADLVDHQMMLSSLGELQANPHKEVATKVQDMLGAAKVFLDYSEGYPRLEQRPLWDKLPYEAETEYLAFKQYLSLEGVRQQGDLISFHLKDVSSWFHTYLWGIRVKAWDMYILVDHQRKRLRRALGMEDTHYKMAGEIITTVQNNIAAAGDDFWKVLKPLAAVTIIEKMIRIQRLSVGLSGNEDASSALPQVPSIQSMLEKVAGVPEDHRQDDVKEVTDGLMNNPEALEYAQDMLLELQGNKD